jgi:large subunit ribosomal protein L32e
MVINKELLQARKKVSDRRPKFVRQESWRYDRLAESWRKPKGKDNKMRKQVSGVPRLVKIGYRGPRKARGLHPSGYTDNLVFNVNGLGLLDRSKDAARIAHVVGQRKRLLILAEARSKGIKVLNPGKEQKAEEVSETKATFTRRKKGDNAASTAGREDVEKEEEKQDEKEFEADDDMKEMLMQKEDKKTEDDGKEEKEVRAEADNEKKNEAKSEAPKS